MHAPADGAGHLGNGWTTMLTQRGYESDAYLLTRKLPALLTMPWCIAAGGSVCGIGLDDPSALLI